MSTHIRLRTGPSPQGSEAEGVGYQKAGLKLQFYVKPVQDLTHPCGCGWRTDPRQPDRQQIISLGCEERKTASSWKQEVTFF